MNKSMGRMNLKILSRFYRLLAAGVILIILGCGGNSSGNTVTIGFLNSETGALASVGASMASAVSIAEKEINQRLSDEGASFSINIRSADTGTDPALALEQLQLFAAQGIKIVIGPLSTAEVIALSDYSIQNGIVLISPSSTATTLENAGDLIIRMPQSDRGHALAITSALRRFGTNFYVPVWRADNFGDDLVKTVGERFEMSGGRFAPGSRYEIATTDFTEALEQLEVQLDAFVDFFGTRSSAVYAVSFDEVWSLLAQASKRNNLLRSVMWYGSDGIALNYGLFQSPEAVQFMIDTNMISPIFAGDPFNEEFINLRSEIEAEVGQKVTPYTILAYDAVLLIAETLRAIGDESASGEFLRDEMIKVSASLRGASGSLTLNTFGDRVSGVFEFWKVTRDSSGAPDWTRAGTFQSDPDSPNSGVFLP